MKTVKTVLKHLKQMGIEVDAKLIVAGISLLILLGGFIFLLWKKRKDKKALAEDEMTWDEHPVPVATSLQAEELKPNALVQDWKAFMKGLPGALRRSVYQFTPIIVLGDTNSGKSSLIDTFSDWRRQSKQYPGAIYNGEYLDLYLGMQTLTVELPGRLLSMPTQLARNAMLRSLKPLFTRSEPVVVVALSLKTLRDQSPDYLRELAESIRGKIDVLSSIRGESLSIRIVLTHTDLVDGFDAWSQFSRQLQINNRVVVDSNALDKSLTEIEDLNRYLPLGLTTLSADSYLDFIAFTQTLPHELARLTDFLQSIFDTNPMSDAPTAEGLYLAASGAKLPGNPLQSAPVDRTKFKPLRRHKIAAACLAASLLAGIVGVYGFERNAWINASEAAAVYDPNGHSEIERQQRLAILDFTDLEKKRLLSLLGLGFFDSGREQVRANFVASIQQKLLLPEIGRVNRELSPLGRSVYLLAILYSTQDNGLGELVRSRLEDWESVTGIPQEIIASYCDRNVSPYEGEPEFRLPENAHESEIYNHQPWIAFVRAAKTLMDRLPMDEAELSQLKSQATHLKEKLVYVRQQSAAEQAYELLAYSVGARVEQHLGPYSGYFGVTKTVDKMATPLEELIDLVEATDLQLDHTRLISLTQLTEALGDAIESRNLESRVLGFDFGTRQSWILKKADWKLAEHKSRLRKMVSIFLHHERNEEHDTFFPAGTAENFNSVSMNPYGKPVAEFTGDAILDGIYTRTAFDTEVQPSVLKVSDLLAMLDFDGELVNLLKLFVQRKVYDYAEDYGQQLADFYSDFSIQARSSQAIQIVLSQMLDPVSPFQDFLRAIETNAAFSFPQEQNELLRPMQSLAQEYEPLLKILVETEDGGDLKRYKSILAQLKQQLSGFSTLEMGADDGAKTAESADEMALRDLLNPAGQISLDILQNSAGNYLQLVDEWVASVQLSPALAKPFREPVLLLYQVGLRDIERNINNQWSRKIALPMEKHLAKFPFNRGAKKEISADTLTSFFHPVRGLFNQHFTRIFEPVLIKERGLYSVRRSNLGSPRISKDILESINRVARMSRRLWDSEGNPRSIEVVVKPKLFGSMQTDKQALTLVYLSSGKTALFNFNQKPALKGLKLDWTRQTTAQVGIQLTNKTTGEHKYPGAVIAQDSHWSFFRLLTKGKAKDLSWSWSFGQTAQGKEVKIPVTFELKEDPWDLFTIPNATRLSGL